jgi:hypothetical protein
MTEIKIDGLKEISDKLGKFPKVLNQKIKETMEKSLRILWEKVPPYPPQAVPPEVYKRTGTLGKSIGLNNAKPTVYSIKGTGKNTVGQFGTNLKYAKHVIDPERQAYMHKPGYKGRQGWWTMDDIRKAASAKIKQAWGNLVNATKRVLKL